MTHFRKIPTRWTRRLLLAGGVFAVAGLAIRRGLIDEPGPEPEMAQYGQNQAMLSVDDIDPAEWAGLYRSVSSAHWVEITQQRLRRYSATSRALVLESSWSLGDVEDDLRGLIGAPGSEELRLYWWGPLDPEILRSEPDWPDQRRLDGDWIRDPAANAAAFLELLRQNHPAGAAADAAARARLTAAAAQGEPALFDAITALLQRLEDGHGSITDGARRGVGRRAPPPEVSSWAREYDEPDALSSWSDLVDDAADRVNRRRRREGGRRAADGAVHWWIQDGIGFLTPLRFEQLSGSADGYDDLLAAESAFDRAFQDFVAEQISGLVIDLRFNDGGWDQVALSLAARVIDAERRVFTKSVFNEGALRSPKPVVVRPATGPRFNGPVAVLQSGMTTSAAEIALLALRAARNVRSFGWPSFGALSDAMSFRLPNGWRGTLSNQVYRTPAGAAFERIGVPPDQDFAAIEPEDDFWDALDRPAAAAEAWLRTRPG